MQQFTQAGPEPAPANISAEAQALAHRAQDLVVAAPSLIIETRAQFTDGAGYLRAIKDTKDKLEAQRTSVTKPLNDILRTINGWFGEPMEKLTKADRIIRGAMGAFDQQEKAREREEQAVAQRKRDEEQAELMRRAERAADKGQEEKASQLLQRAVNLPAAQADYVPQKAKGMSMGTEVQVEIIDPDKLPRAFMVPNESKIRAFAKTMKDDPKGAMDMLGGAVKITVVPVVASVRGRR